MEDISETLAAAFKALEDVKDVPTLMPKGKVRTDESKVFDLGSPKEVEYAKKAVSQSKKNDSDEEVIVDVDANTIDQLKDAYIGNAILRCPVCRTLIYKNPDALQRDEGQPDDIDADDIIFNKGEPCPHCKNKDGFNLVGQVAPADALVAPDSADAEDESAEGGLEPDAQEPETQETAGQAQTDEQPSGRQEVGGQRRTSGVADDARESLDFGLLDEVRLDSIVGKFLKETYANVESYETTCGTVSGDVLLVEGIVRFASGKSKKTTFEFSCPKRSFGGQLHMYGINEMFSKSPKSFGILGKVEGDAFLSESLVYDYRVGDRRVRGRTFFRDDSDK